MKVIKLLNLFFRKSDKETQEAFIDLITNVDFALLGLDLLNCSLLLKKQPIIPDKNLNIILESDIIKLYSPKKRTLIKKEL